MRRSINADKNNAQRCDRKMHKNRVMAFCIPWRHFVEEYRKQWRSQMTRLLLFPVRPGDIFPPGVEQLQHPGYPLGVLGRQVG